MFTHGESKGWQIVRFKVRRMIYDEIKKMDGFPNYKGARLLGLSLSVVGFRDKRTRDIFRDTTIFAAPVVGWTRRNFFPKLLDYNPDIAKACLHGSVTFDDKANQLVKTYNSLGKEPSRDFLKLEPPCLTNTYTGARRCFPRRPSITVVFGRRWLLAECQTAPNC